VKAKWKLKKLGELCRIRTGKKDVNQGNPNGTYPFFTCAAEHTFSDSYSFDTEALLIAGNGDVGQVSYYKGKFEAYQRTYVLSDFSEIHSRFLFLILEGKLKETVSKQKLGNTMPYIKLGMLSDFLVPIPPLDEQHRIVALLDEAFANFATAKANTEKKLQNARELFESHLQTLFAQRGEGWKDKTLEEISTTFGRGKSRHRPRNDPALYGGQYPFVQTGDVRNAKHMITEFSQTYSEAGLAQSKLWPKGTICITIAANIAETGILGFDACFPDSVIGVVPDPQVAEVGYVEYVLQSFKARLQALGQGSAQANINMGTFENERFPFPSVVEQRHIVTKLDAISEESQRLESIYRQKLTALDGLKKSLLNQAFNGQL
jgi:type I restriction enzyme, S subunit